MNDNSISIEVLTGLNFKKWKEDFLFGMELADVHIALTKGAGGCSHCAYKG